MKTPVAIIGGGPAGSASAMWLKTHGIDSVIIERAKFPRYHIGEFNHRRVRRKHSCPRPRTGNDETELSDQTWCRHVRHQRI